MEGGGGGLPAAFTTILTAIWGEFSDMLTTISSNALLLIPVGFMFAGGIIGLAQKMMGTRRRRR